MKSKKNNKNNIEISETQIEEKQFIETPEPEQVQEPPKQKRVLSDTQLEALAKAREKARIRKQELKQKPKKVLSNAQLGSLAKAREKAKIRKQELAELNAKSKGLKEEKLKLDAKEYDRIQKEKEVLDETVKKIEVSNQQQQQPPKTKKKVKKIIYESENTDEDVEEEVIIKKKREPKQRSYSELADMSVEQQIKNKLQQEKITCFFNQLTGKKY